MMSVKPRLLLLTSVILVMSCGSSKGLGIINQGKQTVNTPCAESVLTDDTQYFRATGSSVSGIEQFAEYLALRNARTELVRKLSKSLESVSKNYYQQLNRKIDKTTVEYIEEITDKVVNQSLNTTTTICQATRLVEEAGSNNGKFLSSIIIEVSIENIEAKMVELLRKGN